MPDDLGLPDWASEPRSHLTDSDGAPVVRRSDRRRLGERAQRREEPRRDEPRREEMRRAESRDQWRRERREQRRPEPTHTRTGGGRDARAHSAPESTPAVVIDEPVTIEDSVWLTRAERRRRLEAETNRRQFASRRPVAPVEMVPPTRHAGPEARRRGHGSQPRSRTTSARRRGVAVLALTTALALLCWSFWPTSDSTSPERAAAELAAAALRQKSQPTAAAEDLPTSSPSATAPDAGTTAAPESGSGKVRPVALPVIAAPQVNPNRTVRVGLEVEDGAGVDADEAADIISATLGDKRGWQTRDEVRFRAVSPSAVTAGDLDITIVLASPDLTDTLCAPLKTRGQVSCFNMGKVVLNVRRWTEGVAGYGTDLAAYRQYMVNHEIGHGLYHGHVECPRAGAVAPIMLQQTKGLDGCRPNPWPTAG